MSLLLRRVDWDEAEHRVFVCDRWSQERQSMENFVWRILPESIVQLILDKHKSWALVSEFVE